MADHSVAGCCIVCRCPSGFAEFASSERTLDRCGSSVVEFLRQHDVTCVEAEAGTTSCVCEECLAIVVRCDDMYFCYVAEIEGLRRRASSSETKPVVDCDPLSVVFTEEAQKCLPAAEPQWSPSYVSPCDDRSDRIEIPTSACVEALARFCSTSFAPVVEEAPAHVDVDVELPELGSDSEPKNPKKTRKGTDKDGRNETTTAKRRGLTCSLCFEQCEPGGYRKHFATAHPGRRPAGPLPEEALRCSLCPYMTLTKKQLASHEFLRHDIGGKMHVCVECGAGFRSASSLTGHNVKVHGAKKQFACEQCGKTYSGKFALDLHLQTKHTENPAKRVCPECGEEVMVALYSSHVHHKHRARKVRSFVCDDCGVQYAYKTSLRQHLAKVHGIGESKKDQSSKCAQCGQTFKIKEYYCAHMIKQHGIEVPGLKKYQCQTCDEIFHVKSLFEAHVMLHTGLNKYQCKKCSYSTRFNGNLSKHVKLVHKKDCPKEK